MIARDTGVNENGKHSQSAPSGTLLLGMLGLYTGYGFTCESAPTGTQIKDFLKPVIARGLEIIAPTAPRAP